MELTRQELLADSLDDLLPVLIEEYDPEKVILFGSMARGRVEEWSDLDLLIVKETDESFLERSVRVALLCRAMVGVDYLVYTPTELAEMIQRGNPFILNALQEGRVLYDRRTDATPGTLADGLPSVKQAKEALKSAQDAYDTVSRLLAT
jgi:predicted nucleotidyltransferase